MKNKIYCKTTGKGVQSFFLVADNKEYYLFQQDFRVSVKEYFAPGISVNEVTNYSNARGVAVKKTLDKLKNYIPYIEKEYGIAVMRKTKELKNKPKKPYKRDKFNWQQYEMEYAY